jgi:hypothetical protein
MKNTDQTPKYSASYSIVTKTKGPDITGSYTCAQQQQITGQTNHIMVISMSYEWSRVCGIIGCGPSVYDMYIPQSVVFAHNNYFLWYTSREEK